MQFRLRITVQCHAASQGLLLVQSDFFIDFCVMMSVNHWSFICRYTVKLSVYFTLRESIHFPVTEMGCEIYTCFVASRALRPYVFWGGCFFIWNIVPCIFFCRWCVIVFHPQGVLSTVCTLWDAELPERDLWVICVKVCLRVSLCVYVWTNSIKEGRW